MADTPIREPKQKRSIEKKAKVVEAGLELFREKGFHGTNTIEIAKTAGVSTGTVYSYFKDKTDIYLAASKYLLDSQFEQLLSEIGDIPKPVDIQMFVNKCMDWFISFCASSKQLVNDWALMQEKDPEIMRYFNTYNDTLLSAFVAVLDSPNVDQKNLVEKVYLLLALSDRLGVEYVFEHTTSISLEVLREEMVDMLTYLLSKPE